MVVMGTAVKSAMGVLVVGQRNECVRDDDEVCGQEMPLVCQWRPLLYSRQRPATGVLVDCAPRLHGHELASPAHPPRGSASDAPPPRQRSVRPPTRPQLLLLEPPTPPLRCTSSVPTAHRRCRVPRLPARGLRRPLQGVPPATQRTATKSRPTAPHRCIRGGHQQPPPALQAAGVWVARSSAAAPRCPRSVDWRLAAPPRPWVDRPPGPRRRRAKFETALCRRAIATGGRCRGAVVPTRHAHRPRLGRSQGSAAAWAGAHPTPYRRAAWRTLPGCRAPARARAPVAWAHLARPAAPRLRWRHRVTQRGSGPLC